MVAPTALAAQAHQLRVLVQDCIAKHLYSTAVFFADKLVSLTNYGAADVFLLAQTYYVSRQFRRASMLLRQHGLMGDARFRYLAAKCLAEVGEWDEVLALLADGEPDDLAASQAAAPGRPALLCGREVSTAAAACLLRGRAYEALDGRAAAAQWYRAALCLDPFCEEALAALLDHHLLTNAEELVLVDSLPLGPEHRWLWLLYRCRCKKYNQAGCMEQQLAELEAPCGAGAGSGDAAAAEAAGGAAAGDTEAAGDGGGGDGAGVLQPSSQRQQTGAQQQQQARVRQQQQPQQGQQQPQQQPAAAPRQQTQPRKPLAPTPAREARAGRRAGGHNHQQEQQQPQQAPLWTAADRGKAAAPAQAGAGARAGCGLGANAGVLASRAEWLLHQGRHEECYALTERVLEGDPYATDCLAPHLAAALQLGRKNELFLRSHQLVEEYPDSSLSWFAVGCYYTAARHYEAARRHFSRATALDRNNAHAWVGFGHAFASQDESDQALAAYRTAARLFPGLHTPVLGMGMEYSRMNNLGLAERLFRAAHALCPDDPLVCHEIGVLEYRNGRHALAERWLRAALAAHGPAAGTGGCAAAGAPLPAAAEPTLLALGHARRKLGDYDGALEAYRGALGVAPNAASTHAAVAFALQLKGDCAGAAREYHVALGLRPDDAFSQEMLGEALRQECERASAEMDDGPQGV